MWMMALAAWPWHTIPQLQLHCQIFLSFSPFATTVTGTKVPESQAKSQLYGNLGHCGIETVTAGNAYLQHVQIQPVFHS